jgi:shikimate 5-dehydrogenase
MDVPIHVADGATRLYGIIGDPIAQVKSPGVFTKSFARWARMR